MRYALSIVGALALYWCLINLAAVWRSHVEERRRAMKRHPVSYQDWFPEWSHLRDQIDKGEPGDIPD